MSRRKVKGGRGRTVTEHALVHRARVPRDRSRVLASLMDGRVESEVFRVTQGNPETLMAGGWHCERAGGPVIFYVQNGTPVIHSARTLRGERPIVPRLDAEADLPKPQTPPRLSRDREPVLRRGNRMSLAMRNRMRKAGLLGFAD
jgi:hypothetical protein